MINDLIRIKERQRSLFDEINAAFEKYCITVNGSTTEKDEELSIEVITILEDIDRQIHQLVNITDTYKGSVLVEPAILSRKAAPPVDYTYYIDHQLEIMKMIGTVLEFPLQIDFRLMQELVGLIYSYKAGSGLPHLANAAMKPFVFTIAGMMLIKHFGGEFIKSNGICVRIPTLRCIVEVEDNMNPKFDDWFSRVVVELEGLKNDGTPITSKVGIVKF